VSAAGGKVTKKKKQNRHETKKSKKNVKRSTETKLRGPSQKGKWNNNGKVNAGEREKKAEIKGKGG